LKQLWVDLLRSSRSSDALQHDYQQADARTMATNTAYSSHLITLV
jgi:hypothetical protein